MRLPRVHAIALQPSDRVLAPRIFISSAGVQALAAPPHHEEVGLVDASGINDAVCNHSRNSRRLILTPEWPTILNRPVGRGRGGVLTPSSDSIGRRLKCFGRRL